ncbi:unnamed protein product, partial [Symbiodinium sp. CCMP2456]
VTTRTQTAKISCDPLCWTRVDGVDKGSVMIALVVMDSVLGQEDWVSAGFATIDVTGTSSAEEAFLDYLGQVNETLLDWTSSFKSSGLKIAVEAIHRAGEQLLNIADSIKSRFSKVSKEQLDKIRSVRSFGQQRLLFLGRPCNALCRIFLSRPHPSSSKPPVVQLQACRTFAGS